MIIPMMVVAKVKISPVRVKISPFRVKISPANAEDEKVKVTSVAQSILKRVMSILLW